MVIQEEPNIIVILGSSNNEHGELSDIAKSRLNKGVEEYNKHKNYKIILTGGYGEHFNMTLKPHAYYAKRYLLNSNIPSQDILDFVESKFTLEDAMLTKIITNKLLTKNLIIVTSEFHMKRTKYIFAQVFSNYNIVYSCAKTLVSKEELNLLQQEEEIKFSELLQKSLQRW